MAPLAVRERGTYDQGLTESASPRLRNAIWVLFVVLTFASLLGTAFAPYLLVKSPVFLVALSPAAHHVALAAATVEPWLLISVGTLRRVLMGLSAYGLGYLYGLAALAWLEQRHPRLAQLVRFVERLYARFGIALLVVAPAPTVAVLAGAARSRLAYFLLAFTAGQVLWNTLTQYVGDAFARRTDLLTAFLDEHLLESTLVCLAAVALQQGISRWLRNRRSRAASTAP